MKIAKVVVALSFFYSNWMFADRLINGTPADPKLWPVSVYASMGNSRCSATVVGPRTLLIASHCVSNGGTATFNLAGKRVSSKCARSPHYAGDATADWALCLASSEITGVPYENVNYDAARIRVGDKLTLTGYGCIQPGGGGGNDGIFRTGQSTIKTIPSSRSNDIITQNGAALCFGDSGGAAYYVDSQTGERWVVGVNSRGDINKTSYLSSVSTDKAKDFFKNWSQTNQQVICGIHSETVGCRE